MDVAATVYAYLERLLRGAEVGQPIADEPLRFSPTQNANALFSWHFGGKTEEGVPWYISIPFLGGRHETLKREASWSRAGVHTKASEGFVHSAGKGQQRSMGACKRETPKSSKYQLVFWVSCQPFTRKGGMRPGRPLSLPNNANQYERVFRAFGGFFGYARERRKGTRPDLYVWMVCNGMLHVSRPTQRVLGFQWKTQPLH